MTAKHVQYIVQANYDKVCAVWILYAPNVLSELAAFLAAKKKYQRSQSKATKKAPSIPNDHLTEQKAMDFQAGLNHKGKSSVVIFSQKGGDKVSVSCWVGTSSTSGLDQIAIFQGGLRLHRWPTRPAPACKVSKECS